MRDGVSGGLAGKAQRSYRRSRAARRDHQLAIAEFLEPKHGSSGPCLEHPIPIGHRREFLPSADPAADIIPAPCGVQLELPLAGPDELCEARIERGGTKRSPRQLPAAVRRKGRTAAEPGRPGAATAHRPQSGPGERIQTVSLGGFLYGVILGSAAAAMILVVLMAVFK